VTALAARLAELIGPLRDDPGSSAVLCDIDGTLAPIVADPEAALVPEDARKALRAVAGRYALVACVSGRGAVDARARVGLEELAYAGNHGIELLKPEARDPEVDPIVARKGRAAREFVLGLDATALRGVGLQLEDKGPIQALHWRRAGDQGAAEAHARTIAGAASEAGLEPRWGRKVLEIRPVAGIDKGTAVARLLREKRVQRALFAGDDRTDVDAFTALREMVSGGGLHVAVCIGIASDEAPPELAAAADAMVDGTAGFLELLRSLAEPAMASGALQG